MATQIRNVPAFDRISWKGVGKLNIEQGERESVTIQAPDKVIDDIVIDVKNGELTIKHKWDWRWLTTPPGQSVAVLVTIKNLSAIACSGARSTTGTKIKTNALSVGLNGTGSVDLDVEVGELTARISGTGSLNLVGTANRQQITINGVGNFRGRNLKGQEATVLLNGVGNAEVNVSDRLEACISGVGGITYLGNPEIKENVSGIGKIRKLQS